MVIVEHAVLSNVSHASHLPPSASTAQADYVVMAGQSLRAISAELEARGFLNERGQPFHHKSLAAMLAARGG
jgi:hypothetical protein